MLSAFSSEDVGNDQKLSSEPITALVISQKPFKWNYFFGYTNIWGNGRIWQNVSNYKTDDDSFWNFREIPSSAIHLVCVLVLLFFYHGQNHWKLSGGKYLMPVKVTVSTTKWTISDTKCCRCAQQLRNLHSGPCVNRAHLEDYRRKMSLATLIFSRCPKMTIFWPFFGGNGKLQNPNVCSGINLTCFDPKS